MASRGCRTFSFFQSRTRRCACLLCLILTLAAATSLLSAQTTSGPDVAAGLGIGIHFTTPQPGEIQALHDTGVRWVRTDFDWASTEKAPGIYDFSAYDSLIAQLDSAALRTLFILDYTNRLYDHGLSPADDEARRAFAGWAVAAMTHFRGHHILWEIYNEPNIRFWTPRPNREDYIKLALAVGEAVKESAPDEKLVGPATAEIDLPFLQACFKAGLLNYWSAVSIHTYTPGDPETVANDLLQVRLLERRYATAGRNIPVIVSEWGYSSVWKGMDEQKQAEMLARGWLTQVANDEPLSFWYDWESGSDPRDPEQHFGLIGVPVPAGGAVTIPPKPAYQAAQTLTRMLGDFRFNKRLVLDKPEDYALLFNKGKDVRLAVWTTAGPHQVTLPASSGSFQVTGLTGEGLAALVSDRKGLDVELENQPQYLVPDGPNDMLAIAAAWQRLPADIELRTPGELTVHVPVTNPLQKAVRFRIRGIGARFQSGPGERALPGRMAALTVPLQAVTRSPDPVPAAVELEARGFGRVAQGTLVVAENPLRVTLLPVTRNSLPVLIASPSGDGFEGSVHVSSSSGIDFRDRVGLVKLAPGANDVTVRLPLTETPASTYDVGIQVVDANRNVVFAVPSSRFFPVSDLSRYLPGATPSGYKTESNGGPDLVAALPREGPPEPDMGALKLSFKLPPGSSTVGLQATGLAAIQGEPKALGLWIYGDDSRAVPYLSFADTTGQVFEEGGGPVDWNGWRYIVVFMDAPQASHSEGANDGLIHYPIHWDSLLTLRNPSDQEISGVLYLSGPTLIYGPVSDSR